MNKRPVFWELPLNQLNRTEWEALCDSCGRCCLHKFEDEDTREVRFTDVVCKLLDQSDCRCTDYANRRTLVPNCLELSLDEPEVFRWLPDTCAYRRRFEGKPLLEWHPLKSGRANSVAEAGIGIGGQCIVETYIHPDEIELRHASWIECSTPESQD
ncbi:MAG: YcgN family cysteine cluster protein [Gammaproteobacteria bacterium]